MTINNTEFPLEKDESKEQLVEKLTPILFDPELYNKRINQSEGVDMIKESANNFYENRTKRTKKAYKCL